MSWIDGKTGLPSEAAEKIKTIVRKLEEENETLRKENEVLEKKVQQLEEEKQFLAQKVSEMENVVKVSDVGYVVGSTENPLIDIIAENITIVSEKNKKTDIRELKDEELDLPLPKPKAYKINGKEFIGFMAEEMPEKIRTIGGYSLNMLITLLVFKIQKLEQEINELKKK